MLKTAFKKVYVAHSWILCHESSFSYAEITSSPKTITSVLMALYWLIRFGNFCFNSLSPFLFILHILGFHTMSFQFLRFPSLFLLPFRSYFKLHNLTYFGTDVSMDDMTVPPQTTLNYHIFDLHNNTHPSWRTLIDALSSSLTAFTILILQRSTPHILALSVTVCYIDQNENDNKRFLFLFEVSRTHANALSFKYFTACEQNLV